MATAEVVNAQSAFSDQETSKAHESTIQQTNPVPQSPQEVEKEAQGHNKEQEEPPVKDQSAATDHSEAKKEEEEEVKPVKEERHEEEVKEKEVFDDDQSNPTDHHQITEANTVALADKLQEVKTTTMSAAPVDSHNKAEKEIKQEEVIISSSKVAPEPADVVEVIPVAEDAKKTQEKGDVAATATATATEGSEENKVDEAADHENIAKENEKDKEVKAEEKVVDAEKIKPDE